MATRNAGVAFTALAFAMACSPSPTQPGTPVLVQSIKVTGPVAVQPGQVLRYTATAHYSNGTSRDVTDRTNWSPPVGAGIMHFTGPGVAVATYPGEVLVRATYQDWITTTQSRFFSAELAVLSLEPGTFKVSGRIGEAGADGPLPSASVRVVSGSGAGLRANMLNDRYNFYGLAGPVRLEATGPHHETQTRDLVVTSNLDTEDFFLVTTRTFENVSGPWTFTLVGPSPSCTAGYPAAARNREYLLNITQQNTRLKLDLRRSTMSVQDSGNLFGSVIDRRVVLSFDSLLDDFTGALLPNILDQLSTTETLSFAGRAIGDLSGTEIVATFDGPIQHWTRSTTLPPTWECKATNHAVTIRRQVF